MKSAHFFYLTDTGSPLRDSCQN